MKVSDHIAKQAADMAAQMKIDAAKMRLLEIFERALFVIGSRSGLTRAQVLHGLQNDEDPLWKDMPK